MEGYGNENPGAFQPTRPLRGATVANAGNWTITDISTHAPLAGRDSRSTSRSASSRYFNPRAPCGARHYGHGLTYLGERFQPTRPLRGATIPRAFKLAMISTFQPTRPLRGATTREQIEYIDEAFQPTRPLRGATLTTVFARSSMIFQPTRPLRGATTAVIGLPFLSGFQPTRPLRGATLC